MSEKAKDVVQPEAWYKALPRPIYATLEQIPSADPWFSVYRLRPDLFAIYEGRHFQEVLCFLVLGTRRALLVDTGMGIGNVKTVVDSLWSGPVTVVNTHSHFDHIGGNHLFPLAHVLDHPAAAERMKNGLPHQAVADNLKGDSTVLPYPEDFDPETYRILPCNYETVQEGDTFDLGDKVFHVMATPGHSPDSLMLFEPEKKWLFTGDTFYPATLYAHLSSPDGLFSSFEVYRRTLHRVAEAFSDYTVFPSHNEPIRPGTVLTQAAKAFDDIASGALPYEEDEAGLKKYTFDGFCVVTK